MKLSTRTKYGTRLMIRLGLHESKEPFFLKDIAREEAISEKYLSQIIISLKAAGLVNSFRGFHGGYTLAKTPESITVGDIMDAIEGELALAGTDQTPMDKLLSTEYVTRKLWRDMSKTLRDALGSVALGDLIKQVKIREKAAIIYNI